MRKKHILQFKWKNDWKWHILPKNEMACEALFTSILALPGLTKKARILPPFIIYVSRVQTNIRENALE